MFRRSLPAALAGLMLTSAASAQPGGFPGNFPPGFPGGMPPQAGQILPGPFQDQLKLSTAQKKKVEALQKEIDARLAEILTADQNKSLKEMRSRPMGFGPGGGFGPPGGGPPGFGPPGFGPGGGFGPPGGGVKLDDVKKQLGATEEEWTIIGKKLQKVIAARQVLAPQTTGAGFGGFGGFGAPSGTNRVTQAQAELKAVLKDPQHTKTEVEDRVAAVRKARQQARTELDAAQKDLLQMLTAPQEAILVSLGLLD